MSDDGDKKARQDAVQFMRTANTLDQFFLVKALNESRSWTSGSQQCGELLQPELVYGLHRRAHALLDAVYLGSAR